MSAPVVRWQVVTPQPAAFGRFYAEVFGWRIARDNPLGVREVEGDDGGRGVPGSIWPAPPEAPTFVQLFLEVDDVAATLAAIAQHGGTIVVPRSVLPQGEVMAIAHDPFGLSVGLVERVRQSGAS